MLLHVDYVKEAMAFPLILLEIHFSDFHNRFDDEIDE